MRSLEVCLSPALLHLYDCKGKVVVVIDVFRATSTIATALHNGAVHVIPVAEVATCISLGRQHPNAVMAGERNGKIAEGLQHGNSPLEYTREFIGGKTLLLTTTNGTKLLHMINDAAEIATGAFVNLSAISGWLQQRSESVVLVCAAWKDVPNVEDTLLAGAIAKNLLSSHQQADDSSFLSRSLFANNGGDTYDFLKSSSHYRRLAAFNLTADLKYCSTSDLAPCIPILRGSKLVAFKE